MKDKNHKHKFQFTEKQNEYDLKKKRQTGSVFAEFVCLCGKQKTVKLWK